MDILINLSTAVARGIVCRVTGGAARMKTLSGRMSSMYICCIGLSNQQEDEPQISISSA